VMSFDPFGIVGRASPVAIRKPAPFRSCSVLRPKPQGEPFHSLNHLLSSFLPPTPTQRNEVLMSSDPGVDPPQFPSPSFLSGSSFGGFSAFSSPFCSNTGKSTTPSNYICLPLDIQQSFGSVLSNEAGCVLYVFSLLYSSSSVRAIIPLSPPPPFPRPQLRKTDSVASSSEIRNPGLTSWPDPSTLCLCLFPHSLIPKVVRRYLVYRPFFFVQHVESPSIPGIGIAPVKGPTLA